DRSKSIPQSRNIPCETFWHARYMEAREEARYYQDILDGTGADYQPYAAHRAETSPSQRTQGGAAIA
ncbi:hypothetical protein KI387_009176, partial [Taxus chinensis]